MYYCENCGRGFNAVGKDSLCPGCGGRLLLAARPQGASGGDATLHGNRPAPRGNMGQPPRQPYASAPRQPYAPAQQQPYAPAPQQNPPSAPRRSGSNYLPVIIAAVVAVLLVAAMIVIFPRVLKKDDGDAADTTAAAEADTTERSAEDGSQPSETTSVIMPAETTEVPSAASPSTAPTAAYTQPPTTVVVYTDPPASAVYLIPGNTYMVGYKTPSHAGVVLRSGPGSSYGKAATVKEGVVLRYTGQQSNGYVSVEYYLNGTHYTGWVLYSYLADDHSGGDYYNGYRPAPQTTSPPTVTAPQTASARVGYNTPDHAGIVLRGGPASTTEHRGVLAEGTTVYLYGETSGEYTHVRTADGREGWVLAKYLT